MVKIRTRARAVDMLGKQQIAGIQNALSELFKNAHDAYAKQVQVDYFEDDELLVIRDNGFGMTKEDFENKWLVLGTESKFGNPKNSYKPKNEPERKISGEKGIGRLAIALLGSQVLILTRAKREDGLHDLVMAFIHWGLFEIPGVNLEEIEIPVESFKGGLLPNEENIIGLKASLIKSLDFLEAKHKNLKLSRIKKDIENFTPDPEDLDKFLLNFDTELSLSENGHGTHFIIAPAIETLQIELESEDKRKDYGFRKHLMGFYEQVFDDNRDIPIKTSFNRWRPGALKGEELLDPRDFFLPTELSQSDHVLKGSVDEYGQFSGTLRVYDKIYEDVIIPWHKSAGFLTACGPFKITFGYIMGRAKESLLSPEEWSEINAKLERLGGMYIYRDGIRILPYGDHSVDWLEVEKRRNLSAGYYFFSFRRMFGAVLLTRELNSELVEKAGREGFQQNKAYQQVRDIIINLLTNLAAEFFRAGGTNTELFELRQTELRKQAIALERREKQVSTKKKKLSTALSAFSEAKNSGLPIASISNLRQLTYSRMEAAAKLEDQDKAAIALVKAEKEALDELKSIREKYTLKRPAGVGLSKDLTRAWEAYVIEKSELERDVFQPFEQEISKTLGDVAQQARLYIDQRKRLEDRLKTLQNERQSSLSKAIKQARENANDTRNTVLEVTQKARLALENVYNKIQSDLNRTDLNALEPQQIEALRITWEEELTEVESRHRDALEAARDMLSALSENLKSTDNVTPPQIIEALEERMYALEEQANEDFEMVQLGLAIAIINHEFGAAIKNVRRNIQELGSVARASKSLQPLYISIKSNFEHLDSHMNLFTPLQRRLYRKKIAISGKSIYSYILDLFSNRVERHNVKISATEVFLKKQVTCFPSTLYPVFINLVDNAIYWLENNKNEKEIILDATNQTFLISNNGAPLNNRDVEAIFERGFSRKPGGRGLGLFIARKALQQEDMDLRTIKPVDGFNVTFEIEFNRTGVGNEN